MMFRTAERPTCSRACHGQLAEQSPDPPHDRHFGRPRETARLMNIERVKELAHDPRRVARQFRPGRALAAVQAKRRIDSGVHRARDHPEARRRHHRRCRVHPGRRHEQVRGDTQGPLDRRILNAVRGAVGAKARFLQVSDLHCLHDTSGWHRDSEHRRTTTPRPRTGATVGSGGEGDPVSGEQQRRHGIIRGSHLSPLEMDRDLVKSLEKWSGHVVIDVSDEPNRRFTRIEKRVPFA